MSHLASHSVFAPFTRDSWPLRFAKVLLRAAALLLRPESRSAALPSRDPTELLDARRRREEARRRVDRLLLG